MTTPTCPPQPQSKPPDRNDALIVSASASIASARRICHSEPVDKERILAILREHEPELKAAGLLHLRLFAAAARSGNTLDQTVVGGF
jgi:hypothetical protein